MRQGNDISNDHFGQNIWSLSENIVYNLNYLYVQQWMICGDSAVQATVIMRFINYGDIVEMPLWKDVKPLCRKCKTMFNYR